MKDYVLGFAFSRDKCDMVLIEKTKPEWQKGKLNGIGGKVEPEDQSPLHAMIREFKEETGVDTFETIGDNTNGWDHYATMIFNNDITGQPCRVYVFRMFSNVIYQCKTVEEELIFRCAVDTILTKKKIMHNLPLLIPLALSEEFVYTEFSDAKLSES